MAPAWRLLHVSRRVILDLALDIKGQYWRLPRAIWGLGVFPEHLLDYLHGEGGVSEAVDDVNGPGNENYLGQFRRFLVPIFRRGHLGLAFTSEGLIVVASPPLEKSCIVASDELPETYAEDLRVALGRCLFVGC